MAVVLADLVAWIRTTKDGNALAGTDQPSVNAWILRQAAGRELAGGSAATLAQATEWVRKHKFGSSLKP